MEEGKFCKEGAIPSLWASLGFIMKSTESQLLMSGNNSYNNTYLLSAYCVPGTMQSALHACSPQLLVTTPGARGWDDTHFTQEETEAPKGELLCTRSHSW